MLTYQGRQTYKIYNHRPPEYKIFNRRQNPAGGCKILPINICHFRLIYKLPDGFMKLYTKILTNVIAIQNMSQVCPLKKSQTDSIFLAPAKGWQNGTYRSAVALRARW